VAPALPDTPLSWSERSCEARLVFQLLPTHPASACQRAKLPAAEGAVLPSLFIPTSSFPALPPRCYYLLFTQSGQTCNLLVFVLWCAKRGKGGPEKQQICCVPFLYLHCALETRVGSLCPARVCGVLCPRCVSTRCRGGWAGHLLESSADCKPAPSFPQQALGAGSQGGW